MKSDKTTDATPTTTPDPDQVERLIGILEARIGDRTDVLLALARHRQGMVDREGAEAEDKGALTDAVDAAFSAELVELTAIVKFAFVGGPAPIVAPAGSGPDLDAIIAGLMRRAGSKDRVIQALANDRLAYLENGGDLDYPEEYSEAEWYAEEHAELRRIMVDAHCRELASKGDLDGSGGPARKRLATSSGKPTASVDAASSA